MIKFKGIDSQIFETKGIGGILEIITYYGWVTRDFIRSVLFAKQPDYLDQLVDEINTYEVKRFEENETKCLVIVCRNLFSPTYSGVNNWLWVLGNSLARRGWTVDFYCQAPKLRSKVVINQLTTIHQIRPFLNPFRLGESPLTTAWTKSVTKYFQHNTKKNFSGIVISPQNSLESNFNLPANIKRAICLVTNHQMQHKSIHAGSNKRLAYMVSKEKEIFDFVNTIYIADTETFLLDYLEQMSLKLRKSIYVLGVPVPTPSSFSSGPRSKSFVFIGRRDQRKGAATLLAAWEIIKNELPDWKISFFGQAGNDKEVERILKREKNERVFIDGPVSELEKTKILETLGVLVIPSHYESFGIVALEGMRKGAPIIATNVGGLKDLLGPTAILVPSNSPEDLAKSMLTLARDPEYRLRLGSMAFKRSQTEFDFDELISDYSQLLESHLLVKDVS